MLQQIVCLPTVRLGHCYTVLKYCLFLYSVYPIDCATLKVPVLHPRMWKVKAMPCRHILLGLGPQFNAWCTVLLKEINVYSLLVVLVSLLIARSMTPGSKCLHLTLIVRHMTKNNPICIIVPNHIFQLLNPTDFHRGPKGMLKQMGLQMFVRICGFGRMQRVVLKLTVVLWKLVLLWWDIKWSSVNSKKRRSGFPAHKNKLHSKSREKRKMKHPHRELWLKRCSFIFKTILFTDDVYGQDMLGCPNFCLFAVEFGVRIGIELNTWKYLDGLMPAMFLWIFWN